MSTLWLIGVYSIYLNKKFKWQYVNTLCYWMWSKILQNQHCTVWQQGYTVQVVVSRLKSAYVSDRHDKYWVNHSKQALVSAENDGVMGRILTSCWSLLPNDSVWEWIMTWDNTTIQSDYQAALKAGWCSVSHGPGYNSALRNHSVVCTEVTDLTLCWKKATQCVFHKLWNLLITQHVG